MTTSIDVSTRKNVVPIFPAGVLQKQTPKDYDKPQPKSRNISRSWTLGAADTNNDYPKFRTTEAPDTNNDYPKFRTTKAPDTNMFAMHQDALGGDDESQFEELKDVPCRDFFFDSEKVLSLNGRNFTTFLTRKDATLVMFYNDRFPDSHTFQKLFSEAAGSTKRENHAFAAVDCKANSKLCSTNGVMKVPMMKLYSKSYCIGEMKTLTDVTADILRQYVEMVPLSDSSRMVACSRK